MKPWNLGDLVMCNGHMGVIHRLETGVLNGMATVVLMAGKVTVSLSELTRVTPKINTLTLDSFKWEE